MENMSRVKKYKDLRDSITNGEVDLEDYKEVVEEVVEDEDDLFKFPSFEFDDDFSITSADLTDEKQEEALSRVKERNDDGVTLNTRLDILNQIMSLNQGVKHESDQKVVSEKVVKKEKDEDFQQSISDIIKLEKVDDVKEEIKEEVKEEIKEEEKKEVKVENKEDAPRKLFKFSDDDEDEVDEIDDEDDEEYDESKTSFIEKLLTFVMVVLVLLLIALLGFFIKLSLFSS